MSKMSEFHATKMLFEHHLQNVPDPDLADTFDVDSEAVVVAGKAPTAAAEIQALKSIRGGSRWRTNL